MIMKATETRRKSSRTKRPPAEEPITCGVQGCTQKPTERKPYCIEHLDRLPHPNRLQLIAAQRDLEEQKALKSSRGINVNGMRCKDILIVLTIKGAQTPKRLAIETEIPGPAIDNFVKALERAKLVQNLTLGSRRGTPRRVVTATDSGRLIARREVESPT